MRTDRQIALEEFKKTTVQSATRAGEALAIATANLKLFIPFMHHNIINGLGDLGEANRADLSKILDPEFIKVAGYMAELAEINAIFQEDPVEYEAALTAFLAKYPNVLSEAESKIS